MNAAPRLDPDDPPMTHEEMAEEFERTTEPAPLEPDAATGLRNLPAKPVEQTSGGVCGRHGVFVGAACPKCVTQVKQ